MAKRQKFEDVLPWLVGIELFDTFSIESEDDRRILRVVYDNLSPRSFKVGDVIIREGEVGDDFHILIEGSVQVFRDTPSGDTIALAEMGAGEHVFFGEGALLGSDRRTATVKAKTACRTLALKGSTFSALSNIEPRLGFRVCYCLARRLKLSLLQANLDITTLYETLFREIEGNCF